MNASNNRLIRLPEVTYITGLSRSSIYRLIASGKFPPPIAVGGKARRWTATALQDWIRQIETEGVQSSDTLKSPRR